MKNCFFLRHLETIYNRNHFLSGCELNIPVLEVLPIQCNTALDIAFCSTALRCRQTLGSLLEDHSVGSVLFSNLLLERNLGILQGQKRSEAIKAYPEIFIGDKLDVFSAPPGGETYEHFLDRGTRARDWIYENSDDSHNVLICSHNQFLKLLFFLIQEKPVKSEDWCSLTFPYGKIVQITPTNNG